jgi:hypothetical protein
MKTKITGSLFVLMLLLIFSQTKAQFSIQAEYRPRFEYRYGYSVPPDDNSDPAFFVSQRTRLAFTYKGQGLSSKVTLQDCRIWGDKQTSSTLATLGLYETWVEVKLHDSISLKLGRQELIYDNERVMSKNDWRQSGRVHDAGVFKATFSGWKVDFGAAFNQSKENIYGTDYDNTQPDIKGNYKSMAFIWIAKNFKSFKIGVLGLTDGFQKTGTTRTIYLRGTLGGAITYFKNNFDITIRSYYQMGKTQQGQDISAYYINPELNWNIRKKFLITPGMEYVTGRDALDTADTKYRTFNLLYGTGHKFMGHMDLFTDMDKDTKKAGLVNFFVRTTFSLNEKIALKLDYNYFAIQNNYSVDGVAIDKYLGSEIDLNCKVDFSKYISLLFGYSFITDTPSMENIKGGNSDLCADWAFVMLTLKPTLFTSDK